MRRHLSVLCFLPSLMGYAHAADSTIAITGYLRGDNTCSISVDSQNFSVDLMSYKPEELYAVGVVTPYVPFRIIFNKCGSLATAVKVGYMGPSDNENTTLLKIDAGINAASGMAIQILDNDKNPVALNASRDSLHWTRLTPNQSNTLEFYARLMVTRSPISSGIVAATVNFNLEFQ
ncbi:fimbrial protein [Erwinia sorbitola]|uniref:Fimbrial protein n=1 Tax=Erwinia sorbitola TaxID=2681984 RepID=A0A6I6EQY6_9GAMM|nr:fimbrial protein [Erwinia sorbitola]MTD29410.1 fimbrial protein [Erwinia sorbitola]QGU89171.1 fimbrial protein [Erwinia sorbitola]